MGREFIPAFDRWADSYDQTVAGADAEYREVFRNYEQMLDCAAGKAAGRVLEFGVGTGNLTVHLQKRGLRVVGIELSKKMREKAKRKVPAFDVLDGDFLNFPNNLGPVDTIISSFAFHHLTAKEKCQAVDLQSALLARHGKIVIVDTMFDSIEKKQAIQNWAETKKFTHLLGDLQTEYYPLCDEVRAALEMVHFVSDFQQLNRFAWLVTAERRPYVQSEVRDQEG
ncbi:MAG: methyltransferase domain-containing protein [Sporolactobacillus sp.]